MVRDEEGRFLFRNGRLGDSRFTFATVYCPKVGCAAFVQKLSTYLGAFVSGTLVLGGNFNVPLSPDLDNLMGLISILYKALR